MTGESEKGPDISRADDHPLSGDDLKRALEELPGWRLVEREGVDRIERVFRFRDFAHQYLPAILRRKH